MSLYPKPVPANMQGGAGKSVFRLKFWSKVRPFVVDECIPLERRCGKTRVKERKKRLSYPQNAIQLDLTTAWP